MANIKESNYSKYDRNASLTRVTLTNFTFKKDSHLHFLVDFWNGNKIRTFWAGKK